MLMLSTAWLVMQNDTTCWIMQHETGKSAGGVNSNNTLFKHRIILWLFRSAKRIIMIILYLDTRIIALAQVLTYIKIKLIISSFVGGDNEYVSLAV